MSEATHHRELVRDASKLAEALERARSSTKPLWHLAIAAATFIQAQRFEDALEVYDVILRYRTLHPSAYCNALWVVQNDNTNLPHDPERARQYLEHCLPHAPTNPPVHLNAAAVLAELGELEGAVEQLFSAVYREVNVASHLDEKLFEPLRAHERWAELVTLADLPSFGRVLADVGAKVDTAMGFDGQALAKSVSPEHTYAALRRCIEGDDPRLRHQAVRHVRWWWEEPEYDWCYPNPEWLSQWHQQLAPLITQFSIDELFDCIERDLDGPWVHTAVYSFNILCRHDAYDATFGAGLTRLAPRLAELLRRGDSGVRDVLLDGLFWISKSDVCRAALEKHLAEPIFETLDELSRHSLSDMEKARRDQVDHSVKVLEDLERLGRMQPILERLVEGARGEIADQYLAERLAKLLR